MMAREARLRAMLIDKKDNDSDSRANREKLEFAAIEPWHSLGGRQEQLHNA